jgi:two-component system sensor histidine kinase/response regulator
MGKSITRFLTVSLAMVSVFCVIVFYIQTSWMNVMGAEAIHKIGVMYMAGISEQIATHFATAIDLRLSHVGALVDAMPLDQEDERFSMRQVLTQVARSRGFEYLAFYMEDGSFDMIYGSPIQSGAPEMFWSSMKNGEKKASAGMDSSGVPVVMLGAPVSYCLDGKRNCIALVAGLPTSYFTDPISVDVDGTVVDYSIIRHDGSFIVRSKNIKEDNYFERVHNLYEWADGKTPEEYASELTDAMADRRDYTREVLVAGDRWNLYCTSLPNSEWNLLLYMSYGALEETIDILESRWTKVSVGGCVLILLALLLVFMGYFRLTRKQMRALDEARRSAERTSRAKSEFLSNVSHDIRTPMNGIMGMTTIAIANLADTKQVGVCLKKINASSRYLLGLISDILDMSRIENGKMALNIEPVSLREVMQNIMTIIQPQTIEKKQHFSIYVQDIPYENVCSDAVRLNQILLHLLGNAIKFTKECGKICVILYEEASPKGELYTRVHFRVRDNGIGMTEEFQKRLFEAFLREDNARVDRTAGAGLGMTITRHIVDAMEGMIQIESQLGKGSDFHVILDLEKVVPGEARFILPDVKVLMVGEDELICDCTMASLRSIGLRTRYIKTADEAAGLKKEDYHIILMDCGLAENIYVEYVRSLRAYFGDKVPVMLLTQGDWSELETEIITAGASGFIAKPVFRSSLFYGLRKFVELGNVMPKQEEPMDFNGIRVLVAEDNELNWEILDELLSDMGMKLEWAENGQICVDKLSQSALGEYQVVLMDLRMPVMNGFEATEAIRAMGRKDAEKIPIIAISADAFPDDVEKCYACGMNAHCAKPVDIDKLLRLMEKFLRQSGIR